MIFSGSDTYKSRLIFGIEFKKLKNRTGGINLNHHYLIIHLGRRRCWIGYNRMKRIIRDRLYTLDGKKIRYDEKVK